MSYLPTGQPPQTTLYYTTNPPTHLAQQQAATAPPPPAPSPSLGLGSTPTLPLLLQPTGGPSRPAIASNASFPPRLRNPNQPPDLPPRRPSHPPDLPPRRPSQPPDLPPRRPSQPPDLPPRPQQGDRPQTYGPPVYTQLNIPPDYSQPAITQSTTETLHPYPPCIQAYRREVYSSTTCSGTESHSRPPPAPAAYHYKKSPSPSYSPPLLARSPSSAAHLYPRPAVASLPTPQPPTQLLAAEEYQTYKPDLPVGTTLIMDLKTQAVRTTELPLREQNTQEDTAIVARSLEPPASPVTEVDDLFDTMTISAQQSTPEIPINVRPGAESPYLTETHNLLPASTEQQKVPASPGTKQVPPTTLTDCFAHPIKFATTWYVHPQAPDGIVCSKCYVEHIWPTSFRTQFHPKSWSDGTPRRCRFNCPRITEILFPDAVATGSLRLTLDFLTKRPSILDCAGMSGARGCQGIRWFQPANNGVKDLVVCEACYEDVVAGTSLASHLELTSAQPDVGTWACSLSIPFIRKEFVERQKNGDWARFLYEAKVRMGMPTCRKNIPVLFGSRKWFLPAQGPKGVLMCVACYCDHIVKSGDEHKWEQASDTLRTTLPAPTCLRSQFNMSVAIDCAEEQNNRYIFWRALQKVSFEEPFCSPNGTKTAHWYSLPSQPEGFHICGACCASILESLGVADYFVPAASPPGPDEAALCVMNTKAPRFVDYVERVLELYYTNNVAPLNAYAVKYSKIPRCPRDVDVEGRNDWYGWPDCVICAECYTNFVQGTSLDTPDAMPLRGVAVPSAQICDMYSPRMRGLYTEACSRQPPDASALRAYVAERRVVYWQTMPKCRMMVAVQQHLGMRASLARMQSVISTGLGNMEASINDQSARYDHGELAGGQFHNNLEVQGAQFLQEANVLSSQASDVGRLGVMAQLENLWRKFE